MRIHALRAQNFMSLRVFALEDMDPQLSIIVGPNGSGKSSIFRAIRALIEGARCVGQGRSFEDGQLLCTQGSVSDEFQVALDVEFDTEWERELITTYLCAALTYPGDIREALSHVEPNSIASDEGATLYANWLLDVLRPESIPFLFRGELRFSYGHFVRDNLRLTYTFEIDNVPLAINMGPQFSHYGVFTIGYPPTGLSGTPTASQMMLDDLRKSNDYAEIRETIQGKRLVSQVLPGSIDAKAFVERLAATKVAMEVKTLPRSYSPYPGPHKRLHDLSGRKIDDQQSVFTVAELFYVLLAHGIIMTDNFRHPPQRVYNYAPQDLASTIGGVYDDRQIAQRLFDLKNGSGADRQTYCAIQESFEQLIGEGITFDVVTSVSEEGVALEIRVIESGLEIPIVYHGAGIWEALALSALINDHVGKVALLDEPASNLHPQMQRRFLGIIERAQRNQGGGQVIIITHSQHLLPTQASDLPKIRRLQRIDSSTAVFGLGPTSKIPPDKLEKEMGNSSDLAGLLFASGVILVEGSTEVGAISVWFPQLETSHGRSLADDNLALYSVNGKPGFPFHIQYLVEFGVPWAVICDGDALDPSKPNSVWEALIALGKITGMPASSEFADLQRIAAAQGIFTANTSLTEVCGFEDISDIKRFLEGHPPGASRSKSRQGRYIAHHLSCPEGVAKTIQAALNWVQTSAPEEVRRQVLSQEPIV